jgi:Coenzyme F420-dependent N5,N10-methylene tetrahydromethanopterin reductase and related flavin-dependent oxidoreductases
LWRGERISFEGEYYKTEKATIYDRPAEEIPIYVAAAGAVVARYAGRTGDGFICTSGKKWELYTETLMPSVAEGIGKAVEPKKYPYDNMIEIKVSYDSTRSVRSRIRATGRRWR